MSAIKVLLTLVLVLASSSLYAESAEESTLVEVKELSFAINKPADWHFFQPLNKPLAQESPSLAALLAHYAKTPVVALSKFPADYAQDINPNVRVTLKPVNRPLNKEAVEAEDPVNLLNGIVTSLKPVFQDFKQSGKVQGVQLAGCHAAFARISYKMQLVAGGQTRGNSDLWLVMPRKDYVFLVSGVTREDQGNAQREELQAIVETIKIKALQN